MQITAFDHEIAKVIQRFSQEFDLPAVSAIGVLQLRIRHIEDQALAHGKRKQD